MDLEKIFFSVPIKKTLPSLLSHNPWRRLFISGLERRMYHEYMDRDRNLFPRKMQEDKFDMAKSLLRSIDRGLTNGQISKAVWKRFIYAFTHVYSREESKVENFEKEYGLKPPAFLTVSPTKHCNLHCSGCYADSLRKSKEKLDYGIVDRIIREQKELWDSHFTVISGGEPLLYRSCGKSIFDLAREHGDTLFLMYTNGTLIDEDAAERFVEAGNITPAISVEGFEEETDRRRGKGVHQKILNAFSHLRRVGVPFGISITATRENAELILSDEFIDYYFHQHGALYGWIFQYMPIGRSFTLDLMVTPKQRLEMYRKTWKLIREEKIFLADFWNCGAVSSGCISAGKPGGYFYIDWNGNIMPCVFNPYRVDNINDVYRRGGNLNTVLFSLFFKKIREWQEEYALQGPAHRMGNIIIPCAIRDHYEMMRELIRKTGAQPADKAAAEALEDEGYYRGLVQYGKELEELTDEIWQKEYLEPERKRALGTDRTQQSRRGDFFNTDVTRIIREKLHLSRLFH